MSGPYDDEYSTCARTFATLRVYSQQLTADELTAAIGLPPSRALRPTGGPPSEGRPAARLHGWFLTSDGSVSSRDARRHIDWLLHQLPHGGEGLRALVAGATVRADLVCGWFSATGRGGPTLSPAQLGALAKLGIDVWFDVYLASPAPAP